jgi:hypothetical protein
VDRWDKAQVKNLQSLKKSPVDRGQNHIVHRGKIIFITR